MNQILSISFGETAVSFREDGYLNATQIAAHFGKRPVDYLKTERTQEYISALSEVKKITSQNLIVVRKGNSKNFTQGTWLHPKLAIDFARWLDPKFAVWCDEQIEQLLSGNQPSRLKPQKPRKALPNGLSGEQQEAVIQLHRTLVQAAPKSDQRKRAISSSRRQE